MVRFVENQTPLTVRATMPVRDAVHAVRVAKLLLDEHHATVDVVNAVDGRTVIGSADLASLTLKD